MPRTKKVVAEQPTVDPVAGAISQLAKAIGSLETNLSAKLDTLAVRPATPQLTHPGASANISQTAPVSATSANKETYETATPVPHEWRDVIDRTLNAKFGAGVNYQPNGRFELIITVPEEYSNASQREKEMYNNIDRRIKVMDNYLGAQGVQIYCDQIAKHLGAEIRAKIADDRAKLIII